MPETKTVRTQSIIDTYRGVPLEFGMLKGLLCLPSETCGSMRSQLDMGLIATRMDEINAEAKASVMATKASARRLFVS